MKRFLRLIQSKLVGPEPDTLVMVPLALAVLCGLCALIAGINGGRHAANPWVITAGAFFFAMIGITALIPDERWYLKWNYPLERGGHEDRWWVETRRILG